MPRGADAYLERVLRRFDRVEQHPADPEQEAEGFEPILFVLRNGFWQNQVGFRGEQAIRDRLPESRDGFGWCRLDFSADHFGLEFDRVPSRPFVDADNIRRAPLHLE